MNYTYQNNQSGNGGFMTMHNDSEEVGRLTYTIIPEDNRYVISFVNIYPKFEGQGLGKLIVKEAIDFARDNNWKVYPHCSYARTVMSRMDDVQDILLKY
ncbi:GNAT family N-acetyltransferase [Soonwooa sp.]|uniref:GNAT family N-acetyltransferase n=1 Tax=Soonwooa sp. TaxID=1938592 RepID=UPI0028A2A52D|nr:GNAT family N-acetyltransferase [Soonwooa sp.]